MICDLPRTVSRALPWTMRTSVCLVKSADISTKLGGPPFLQPQRWNQLGGRVHLGTRGARIRRACAAPHGSCSVCRGTISWSGESVQSACFSTFCRILDKNLRLREQHLRAQYPKPKRSWSPRRQASLFGGIQQACRPYEGRTLCPIHTCSPDLLAHSPYLMTAVLGRGDIKGVLSIPRLFQRSCRPAGNRQ